MNTNKVITHVGDHGALRFILFGVLAVLAVLQLVGTIDISWWWVTAPLWGPIALFILSLVCVFIVTAGVGLFGLLFAALVQWRQRK